MTPLYLNDDELLKKLNLPIRADTKYLFKFLEDMHGFPKPEPEFGNKRYYPAVVAWLDMEFKIGDRRPYFVKDDIEPWRKYPTSSKRKRKTVWGE